MPDSSENFVEICIGSLDDALKVARCGWTNIELNSALPLGGLTPSAGLVAAVLAETKLQVVAMVRPRPGGFCYSERDWHVLIDDAERLAEMGVQLFTIERQKKLFDENWKWNFLKQYSSISFFYGDGFEGQPDYAPFDRILITAAAPFIPQKLIEQLSIGGKMVIPLGAGDVQQMMRITKLDTGVLQEEVFENFSFVPMLKGKNE